MAVWAARRQNLVERSETRERKARVGSKREKETREKETTERGEIEGKRKCSPRGSRVAAGREWPTASTIGSRFILSSRFVLARQVLEHIHRGSSLIGLWPTPIPLAQPRLGLWPAAAEQAVERLLMRMVEDGNGRARAGRGRMKWRGKVVLSFGGGFIGLAVAAWEARVTALMQREAMQTSAEKARWSGLTVTERGPCNRSFYILHRFVLCI